VGYKVKVKVKKVKTKASSSTLISIWKKAASYKTS